MTVDPLTVHTSGRVEAYVTGSPDDAVAVKAKGVWALVRFGSGVNVMVCAALLTTKLRVTLDAGSYVAFPAWEALTVHVPMDSRVMVWPFDPLALHIAGVVVAKLTGSPDDAVARTVNGDCTIVRACIVDIVIVCASVEEPALTANACCTCGAAL